MGRFKQQRRTGLKLQGAGEWLIEKHGAKTRRSWRKLHIGVDADTGQIVAAALTTRDVDDGSQVGPLLDQVAASVASFTGDGAYDQDGLRSRTDQCRATEVETAPAFLVRATRPRYLVSGHSPASIGRKATAAGIVPR